MDTQNAVLRKEEDAGGFDSVLQRAPEGMSSFPPPPIQLVKEDDKDGQDGGGGKKTEETEATGTNEIQNQEEGGEETGSGGYRDDFYSAENIVGYTGTIGQNETVYFKKGDEYGRITQDHKQPENIGRNKVREDALYEIKNEDHDDGKGLRAREYKGDGKGGQKATHTSRNPFVPVDSEETRQELAKAIDAFKNEKEKSAKKKRKKKDGGGGNQGKKAKKDDN